MAKLIHTILLVHHHEVVLGTLHNYLEAKGYNLIEAHDGHEALLAAELHRGLIHILVTDLVMDRMNGAELVRRLLPLRPDMQVIFMSAFPTEIMAQHGLTPLVPILPKPFPAQRLLRTIKHLLANPQSERTVASLVKLPGLVKLPDRLLALAMTSGG